MSKLSEARRRANKKWNDEHLNARYDSLRVLVKKGQRDKIKAHAAERGESMNGFVNRAIDETIKRDREVEDLNA